MYASSSPRFTNASVLFISNAPGNNAKSALGGFDVAAPPGTGELWSAVTVTPCVTRRGHHTKVFQRVGNIMVY
jgi:hypothetical protein